MGSSSDSSSNQNNSTEKEIDSIKLIDVVIKRISYTFIGCIIVLAILFLIIILIVPNDKINIAFSFNDAFIGVIATLIGVMVTFVIGYQILNALQIKKDIETMQKKTVQQQRKQKKQIKSAIESLKKDFDEKNTFIEKRLELELLNLELKKANEKNQGLDNLADYIVCIVQYVESTKKIIEDIQSINLIDKRREYFENETFFVRAKIKYVLDFEVKNPDEEEFDNYSQLPIPKREDWYMSVITSENVKHRLLSIIGNESDLYIKQRINDIYDLLNENNLLPAPLDFSDDSV